MRTKHLKNLKPFIFLDTSMRMSAGSRAKWHKGFMALAHSSRKTILYDGVTKRQKINRQLWPLSLRCYTAGFLVMCFMFG